MNRRNFLASLLALPFAAVRLEAARHYWTSREIKMLGDACRRMEANEKALKANTQALLLYAPRVIRK